MKRHWLILGMLFGVIGSAVPCSARQSEIATGQDFTCPVPPGFSVIKSATEIPKSLRDQFPAGVAMLGEKWNDSDVMDGLPNSGMEFVLHRGRRWIVGIGNGGIATSLKIYAYDLSNDGKDIKDVSPPVPSDQEPSQEGFCEGVIRSAH